MDHGAIENLNIVKIALAQNQRQCRLLGRLVYRPTRHHDEVNLQAHQHNTSNPHYAGLDHQQLCSVSSQRFVPTAQWSGAAMKNVSPACATAALHIFASASLNTDSARFC